MKTTAHLEGISWKCHSALGVLPDRFRDVYLSLTTGTQSNIQPSLSERLVEYHGWAKVSSGLPELNSSAAYVDHSPMLRLGEYPIYWYQILGGGVVRKCEILSVGG